MCLRNALIWGGGGGSTNYPMAQPVACPQIGWPIALPFCILLLGVGNAFLPPYNIWPSSNSIPGHLVLDCSGIGAYAV